MRKDKLLSATLPPTEVLLTQRGAAVLALHLITIIGSSSKLSFMVSIIDTLRNAFEAPLRALFDIINTTKDHEYVPTRELTNWLVYNGYVSVVDRNNDDTSIKPSLLSTLRLLSPIEHPEINRVIEASNIIDTLGLSTSNVPTLHTLPNNVVMSITNKLLMLPKQEGINVVIATLLSMIKVDCSFDMASFAIHAFDNQSRPLISKTVDSSILFIKAELETLIGRKKRMLNLYNGNIGIIEHYISLWLFLKPKEEIVDILYNLLANAVTDKTTALSTVEKTISKSVFSDALASASKIFVKIIAV